MVYPGSFFNKRVLVQAYATDDEYEIGIITCDALNLIIILLKLHYHNFSYFHGIVGESQMATVHTCLVLS